LYVILVDLHVIVCNFSWWITFYECL